MKEQKVVEMTDEDFDFMCDAKVIKQVRDAFEKVVDAHFDGRADNAANAANRQRVKQLWNTTMRTLYPVKCSDVETIKRYKEIKMTVEDDAAAAKINQDNSNG